MLAPNAFDSNFEMQVVFWVEEKGCSCLTESVGGRKK